MVLRNVNRKNQSISFSLVHAPPFNSIRILTLQTWSLPLSGIHIYWYINLLRKWCFSDNEHISLKMMSESFLFKFLLRRHKVSTNFMPRFLLLTLYSFFYYWIYNVKEFRFSYKNSVQSTIKSNILCSTIPRIFHLIDSYWELLSFLSPGYFFEKLK